MNFDYTVCDGAVPPPHTARARRYRHRIVESFFVDPGRE